MRTGLFNELLLLLVGDTVADLTSLKCGVAPRLIRRYPTQFLSDLPGGGYY